MPKAPSAQAPVHTRVILHDDGEASVALTAYCRKKGGFRSLSECARCAEAVSIPEHVARPDAAVVCAAASIARGRADVTELATRTPLGMLTRRRLTCVEGKTSYEVLESLLLDEDFDALTVVDKQKRPIGIVTKSDLLRRARDRVDESGQLPLERGFGLDTTPRAFASDLMTPVVHTLPEETPLSFALALFAIEDVGQIPIVSASGEVVGMLAMRDMVRWFAEQMGFVTKAPGA